MIRPAPPDPRELLLKHTQRYPGQPLLIAFDFDGTLVPIVSRPELVEVPTQVREDLSRIARAFASRNSPVFRIAIVTGRAPQDLARHLPECPGLDLIGNHGLEWWTWERVSSLQLEKRDLTPQAWKAWRETFLKELRAQVSQVGGEIEDKRASLTLHYRNSGTKFWESQQGHEWLEARLEAGTSALLGGKAAWNLLPAGASKGISVMRYCEEFGCAEVVFFGDEPTDESVFTRTEKPVIGIRVGKGDSAARFGVEDVQAVRHWLKELAEVASG